MTTADHRRAVESTATVIEAPPFRIALAEWQHAQAAVSSAYDAAAFDPTKEKEEDLEKAEFDVLEALHAAEWKLVRTPASGIVEIRMRAMVVQDLFNRAMWTGPPSGNVHRHMLDALIYEILSPAAED